MANELPQGVSIRKFKNHSVIQIDFIYNGVRCREVIREEPTIKNIKSAERLRNTVISEIDRKGKFFNYADYFPNSSKVKLFCDVETIKEKHLLSSLCKQYLTHTKNMVENKKLSPSTYTNNRKIVDNNLIPNLGHIFVEDLKVKDIKAWLIAQGGVVKTLKNKLSVLRIILNEAKNDELIPKNPIEQIAISRFLNGIASESEYEVEPFTDEEKQKIIDTAQGQFKNLIKFCFWSGLRTSELIALRWSDIDFDNNQICVSQAKIENVIKTTKTKAGTRKILMLPRAREALLEQLKYTENCEIVFNNPNTNKPYSDSNIVGNAWRRLLAEIDIKYRNPYQMRHTYASTLLSNGENVWWLCSQMGHETVEMLFKHYGKWIPQGAQNGYKLVGGYV